MNLTCIIFGLLFTAAGALFAAGKLHPHLSAWKNMPEEEKETINIVPLSRNIGEMIALSGIIFLIKGFWAGFHDHWFLAAMAAWMVIAGLDLYTIEKQHRYEKRDEEK